MGPAILDEFRVAYARVREHDITNSLETAWNWLEGGYQFVPEALQDRVAWWEGPVDP
jgi:hypothetical protein